MDPLAEALADAGGLAAPPERMSQLRKLAADELERSAAELALARSGYPDPVTVLFAAGDRALLAALPLAPALRADPAVAGDRGWALAAATVGALAEAGAHPDGPAGFARGAAGGGAAGGGAAGGGAAGGGAASGGAAGGGAAGGGAAGGGAAGGGAAGGGAGLLAGQTAGGALVLSAPAEAPDPELAVLAFEEQVAGIDRLRTRALAVPPGVLADATDLRTAVGAGHPLRVAALIAALGGRPADPASADAHEEAVLARLGQEPGVARPHDDPDPARRAARRILQRLDGMGKWGGYHTEFAHLARGFAPADQRLAAEVGEALLTAGLLAEKPSVGQRHVFLNPRRARDVHALIERGQIPVGLDLDGV